MHEKPKNGAKYKIKTYKNGAKFEENNCENGANGVLYSWRCVLCIEKIPLQ